MKKEKLGISKIQCKLIKCCAENTQTWYFCCVTIAFADLVRYLVLWGLGISKKKGHIVNFSRVKRTQRQISPTNSSTFGLISMDS
jgi:hypothetical protein